MAQPVERKLQFSIYSCSGEVRRPRAPAHARPGAPRACHHASRCLHSRRPGPRVRAGPRVPRGRAAQERRGRARVAVSKVRAAPSPPRVCCGAPGAPHGGGACTKLLLRAPAPCSYSGRLHQPPTQARGCAGGQGRGLPGGAGGRARAAGAPGARADPLARVQGARRPPRGAARRPRAERPGRILRTSPSQRPVPAPARGRCSGPGARLLRRQPRPHGRPLAEPAGARVARTAVRPIGRGCRQRKGRRRAHAARPRADRGAPGAVRRRGAAGRPRAALAAPGQHRPGPQRAQRLPGAARRRPSPACARPSPACARPSPTTARPSPACVRRRPSLTCARRLPARFCTSLSLFGTALCPWLRRQARPAARLSRWADAHRQPATRRIQAGRPAARPAAPSGLPANGSAALRCPTL